MYIKKKSGQSTVEYVLLVTAVLAVVIALLSSSKSGFQTQLNSTLSTASNDITSMGSVLSNSHAQSNGTSNASTTPPISISVTNGE